MRQQGITRLFLPVKEKTYIIFITVTIQNERGVPCLYKKKSISGEPLPLSLIPMPEKQP